MRLQSITSSAASLRRGNIVARGRRTSNIFMRAHLVAAIVSLVLLQGELARSQMQTVLLDDARVLYFQVRRTVEVSMVRSVASSRVRALAAVFWKRTQFLGQVFRTIRVGKGQRGIAVLA